MNAQEMAEELRRLVGVFREDPRAFVERSIGIARARVIFRGIETGPGVCAKGRLDLRAEGTLRLGARVTFLGGMIPTQIRVHPGASLEIGESSVFNYGASLEAKQDVRIGARCMLASMVRISDCDGRRVAPVVLGDDVWVAHGAIVGPGVTIGSGSVIGAGSVVWQNVAPGSLAMGNPARVMSLSLVTDQP